MRYIDSLKVEAKEAATWRGHTMSRFSKLGKTSAESTCTVCGAGVSVDIHPAPNGIDIGGPAIAVGCAE